MASEAIIPLALGLTGALNLGGFAVGLAMAGRRDCTCRPLAVFAVVSGLAEQKAAQMGDFGYLWWIDRPGSRRYGMQHLKDPFYIVTGYRGHALFVFPSLDLVIAHQVATVGGVGLAAQAKRAREGSPEVTDDDLGDLVARIIQAHPNAKAAFAGDADDPTRRSRALD